MNVYLHQNYPPELQVNEDLVDTILRHIRDDQQDSLENNIDDDNLIINKFQRGSGFRGRNQSHGSNKQNANNKTKVGIICQICGGTNHDGLKDDCDLMCMHFNISNFLSSNKKLSPKVIKDLMDKFKERNKERVQRAKQKLKIYKLGLSSEVEDTIMKVMAPSSDDASSDLDTNSNTSN